MAREVLPHVPDAWVDHNKTKTGYEIPFNRHFYVYEPPRTPRRHPIRPAAPGAPDHHDARRSHRMNRPYPHYSDSGVGWLDGVPEHWEVRRLAASVKRSDERFDPDDAPSHPSATPYIGLEHVESWTGALLPHDDQTPSEATANAFGRGDVLFGKLRPYLAKAFSADFDGTPNFWCWPPNFWC